MDERKSFEIEDRFRTLSHISSSILVTQICNAFMQYMIVSTLRISIGLNNQAPLYLLSV